MVDRITPATTDKHRTVVRRRFGIDDAWPVVTEPFTQWVIEDDFPAGRPAWESEEVKAWTRDGLHVRRSPLRRGPGMERLTAIGCADVSAAG